MPIWAASEPAASYGSHEERKRLIHLQRSSRIGSTSGENKTASSYNPNAIPQVLGGYEFMYITGQAAKTTESSPKSKVQSRWSVSGQWSLTIDFGPWTF